MMEKPTWRILLVDDDRDDHFLTREMLAQTSHGQFQLDWAPTYFEGQAALRGNTYDAILVDYELGSHSGIDFIQQAIRTGCPAPMLMLTGQGSYEEDLQSMQAGAADYLIKQDLTSALLERSIRFAINRKRSESERQHLFKEHLLEVHLHEETTQDAAASRALAAWEDTLRNNEQLLKETADRFQTLADNISQLAWMTDETGWIFWYNQRWFDYTGTSLSEVEGWGWQKLHHPDHLQRVVDNFRICIQAGEVWEDTFPLRGKDGQYRWFLSRALPIRDETGKVVRWFGTNTDVTELRKREQNAHFLAELGKQLVSLGEPQSVLYLACQQTAAYLHADGCFIDEQARQSNETVVYGAVMKDADPFHARFALDMFPQALVAALKNGQKVIIDDTLNHPLTRDDRQRLLQPANIAALVMLPRLANEQWIGNFTMISQQPRRWQPDELELLESVANLAWLAMEQARMQQDLKTAEERFRIALQSTPLVVFTQDRDLRYTWIYNPHPGFKPEQVLGKRDDDLLEAHSAAILNAPKRVVLESGQSIRQEVTYQISEQTVTYDLTLEPLKDSSGAIIGLTGAAMDLTNLRKLESERIDYAAQMEVQRRLIQQREAERLDIARDLHDGLLQDMTLLGFGLAEAMGLDEKQARLARLEWVQSTLQKQAREIRTFCNDLRPPALAPFGLEKAIRSHISEYQQRHPDLRIHLNLAADRQTLPENTRMALFRVYQEILNNVARHAKASQLWITWSLAEDEATLEIEDDGVGYQVPSDWVAQARSGHLGLLGMRERVQSIGGQITFDSQPGHGARVRVTVARSPESETSEEAAMPY